MYWFSMSAAPLVSIGIIAIGAMYLARPAAAMRSFGLPLPGEGESTMWWLRLKGVRDVAAGLLCPGADSARRATDRWHRLARR